MSFLGTLVRNLWRHGHVERDLDEEVQAHLELLVDQHRASGLDEADARRAARLELGGVGQVKDAVRDVRRGIWLEHLWQDLRYGWRQLCRQPGFTGIAALTLGLGVGATTAIFGVVHAVALRPLPFQAPDQLVRVVRLRARENVADNASYPDFADWRTRNHVFTEMAAFHTDSFTLSGSGEALHVPGAIVSAELFALLGVQPALGRTFLPQEDRPGGTAEGFTVILSHRLWAEHFGSDPRILQHAIDLDDRRFTVVGVMPAGFQFPVQAAPIDFWTTIAVDFIAPPGMSSMAEQRGAHFLDVIARLKPRTSPAQAQTEMGTIVSALNAQYRENAPSAVRLVPESEQVAGPTRPVLLLLLAAVGCVLLIGCANVANLLLARGATREREIAVRGALGAGRGRIIRQLLVESVLLAGLGGAVGVALAFWGFRSLVALIPAGVPRLGDAHFDGTMLLFTLAVSVLTGIVFGLAPALQVSQVGIVDSLKESGHGLSASRQHNRLRSVLVVADVAIAAALLCGAGLLIQSLWRIQRVDPGFNPDHVLTFKIDLPYVRYAGAAQPQFFQGLSERLQHLPGVQAASGVLPLPLGGDYAGAGFEIDGQPMTAADRPRAHYAWVEPAYFRTLRIALLQGRDFTVGDNLQSNPVVIVNETLARRFFPDGHVIGSKIRPGISNGYDRPPMRQIVGVIADVRSQGLTTPVESEVYVPHAQSPLGSMIVVVQTATDPLGLVTAVRNQVAAMDSALPIYNVRPLNEYVAQSVALSRFVGVLFGLFAGLALLLAAVGLYGVISYATTRRTHEIGLRIALGARSQEVLRLVVGQGFTLSAIGAGIGLVGALMLSRAVAGLLYGVTSTDPLTFVAAATLLIAVAVLASYVPARRAAQIDPVVALRSE
jgi:predicted permease